MPRSQRLGPLGGGWSEGEPQKAFGWYLRIDTYSFTQEAFLLVSLSSYIHFVQVLLTSQRVIIRGILIGETAKFLSLSHHILMSRQLSSLRSIYNVGIWPRTCNKISAYDRCSIRRLLSTTSDHNSASESVKQNDFKLSRVFVCQTQYQSIMKYYVNKGDVNSVEHIMVEMDRGGIPPNLTTINMLLSAYAAKKDGLGAQIVFDEMQKIGIKSNNLSLGILMNAYANQGDFTAVDKVLHDATAAEDANIGIK